MYFVFTQFDSTPMCTAMFTAQHSVSSLIHARLNSLAIHENKIL